MKAQELRIGNYHLYHIVDEIDERKEWDEICQIDYDDLRILTEFKDNSEYKPIPLTEEILLKAGFVKLPDFTFYDSPTYHINYYTAGWAGNENLSKHSVVGTDLSICIVDGKFHLLKNVCDDNDYMDEGILIQYLHELQNLYHALKHEELEVKL